MLASRLPWLDPTLAGLVVATIAFLVTLLVRGGERPEA
jgi:hypothetical protein